MIDVSFKIHPRDAKLFCLVKVGVDGYIKPAIVTKVKITIDENGTEVAYMVFQPGYACEYFCYHDELYETEEAANDALNQHIDRHAKCANTNG